MEALVGEILYEIGHRITMHLMMRWCWGQKMKGLCKEDNREGRWESEAFGGYLWSTQIKYMLCYRQNKTPLCMLSAYFPFHAHMIEHWPLDLWVPTHSHHIGSIPLFRRVPVHTCWLGVKWSLKCGYIIPAHWSLLHREPQSAAYTVREETCSVVG